MLSREHLVFRALCVLDEAQQAARAGRVPASAGLRLALAYLYAVGNDPDRYPHDKFWQLATQEDTVYIGHGSADAYARSIHMTSCINAIARAADMEMTVDLMAKIGRLRCGS